MSKHIYDVVLQLVDRGRSTSPANSLVFALLRARTRPSVEISFTSCRKLVTRLRVKDIRNRSLFLKSLYSWVLVSSLCLRVVLPYLTATGSDTANTALAATFYFLAHHPNVLARLSSDIRDAFPDVESIVSGPRLQKLRYLRACLEESMRLCPPVPMHLPREVLAGGLKVDDHVFPAGTVVGVPTYALHRSEEHFEDPFSYRPERWLLRSATEARSNGVTEEVLARQRRAFVPFSLGPRACIGRGFALMELEISIARILWLYDIRNAPGTEELGKGPQGEYKIKKNFVVGKEGPILQFRRRV